MIVTQINREREERSLGHSILAFETERSQQYTVTLKTRSAASVKLLHFLTFQVDRGGFGQQLKKTIAFRQTRHFNYTCPNNATAIEHMVSSLSALQ